MKKSVAQGAVITKGDPPASYRRQHRKHTPSGRSALVVGGSFCAAERGRMRSVEQIEASPHEFGCMVYLLAKQLEDNFPHRRFFFVEDWDRVKRDEHVDDVVIHLPSTDD